MNDTAKRLLDIADAYANAVEERDIEGEKKARQALQDELIKLFAPLTDEQIAQAWAVGEHNASAATKRRITKKIEAMHGIGETQ